MKRQATSIAKTDAAKKWYLVDAADKTLGRLATKVATILRGKNKPTFTPHVDTGDYVVVINAEKIKVTGNKDRQKVYFTHSGYPGGHKLTMLRDKMIKNPQHVIFEAVKGMLPTGKLRDQVIKKLKIFRGEQHLHKSQSPEKIDI